MITKIDRNMARKRKALRSKEKVRGTKDKPRLTVFKSLNNIFVQLIDDERRITLVSTSSIDGKLKENVKEKLSSNINSAKIIGKDIAERAAKKKITKVIFDRNGYLYTGVIKALADAAREHGLQF